MSLQILTTLPGATSFNASLLSVQFGEHILLSETRDRVAGAQPDIGLFVYDPWTWGWVVAKAAEGIIAWVAGQVLAGLFKNDPSFNDVVTRAVYELKAFYSGELDRRQIQSVQSSLNSAIDAIASYEAAPGTRLAADELAQARNKTRDAISDLEPLGFQGYGPLVLAVSLRLLTLAAEYKNATQLKDKKEAKGILQVIISNIEAYSPRVDAIYQPVAVEFEARGKRILNLLATCEYERRDGERRGGRDGGTIRVENQQSNDAQISAGTFRCWGSVDDNGTVLRTSIVALNSGFDTRRTAENLATELYNQRRAVREAERLEFDKKVGMPHRSSLAAWKRMKEWAEGAAAAN